MVQAGVVGEKSTEMNADSSVIVHPAGVASGEMETISLSNLMDLCIDKNYEDFHELVHELVLLSKQAKSSSSPKAINKRKEKAILNYLMHARRRMLHLLVLLKWSVQSPLLTRCQQMLQSADEINNQLNEANDRLFFMHSNLNRAKERVYDISTAVGVLFRRNKHTVLASYGGEEIFTPDYSAGSGGAFLPTIIENVGLPRELPAVDIYQAAQELDEIIRFRLLDMDIPSQFDSVVIKDGFVTFQVAGEFELTLTVHGNDATSSLWRVVGIQTILNQMNVKNSNCNNRINIPKNKSSSTVLESVAPNDEHLQVLVNIVQHVFTRSEKKRLESQKLDEPLCLKEELYIKEEAKDFTATSAGIEKKMDPVANAHLEPLVESFHILRDFCSCLALEVLATQAFALTAPATSNTSSGRWANIVKVYYHRSEHILDLCYWPSSNNAEKNNSLATQNKPGSTYIKAVIPAPSSVKYIRLTVDPKGEKLVALDIFPENDVTSLSVLSGKADEGENKNLKEIMMEVVPNDMRTLSVEKIVDKGRQIHAACELHSLQTTFLLGLAPTSPPIPPKNQTFTSMKLISGLEVSVSASWSSVCLKRRDLVGLHHYIEIGIDVRSGEFVVGLSCDRQGLSGGSSSSSYQLILAVKQFQTLLNSTKNKSQSMSDLHEESREELVISLTRLLGELALLEVGQLAASKCVSFNGKPLYPQRHVNLSWDKFIEFRASQGAGTQALKLKVSDQSLYFPLSTQFKECKHYLVLDIKAAADIENKTDAVTSKKKRIQQHKPSSNDWLRLPCFSILQVTGLALTTNNIVQRAIRLPAFSKFHIQSSWVCSSDNEKAKPSLKMNHVIDYALMVCFERLQGIQILNSARRVKLKISYSGEATTGNVKAPASNVLSSNTIGGQVVVINLPVQMDYAPLEIESVRGYLPLNGYGFEVVLVFRRTPFNFLLPAKDDSNQINFQHNSTKLNACFPTTLFSNCHRMLSDDRLLFRYPSSPSLFSREPSLENPLSLFFVDLFGEVKPLTIFGKKLATILGRVNRYGRQEYMKHYHMDEKKENVVINEDNLGLFYVESATPFCVVLACLVKNPTTTVALDTRKRKRFYDDEKGDSRKNLIVYRVIVRFKHKVGYLLTMDDEAGNKTPHPLLNMIQNHLNMHGNVNEFLEAIERTTWPLACLSRCITSQLVSEKYHRKPLDETTATDSSNASKSSGSMMMMMGGKKGGKGMKLGYMSKKSNVNASSGASSSHSAHVEDKFVPSKLVLIPCSINHVKLAYGNRCAVDIIFHRNKVANVRSAGGGVPVPSCSGSDGQNIKYTNFLDKMKAICVQMGTL